MRSKVFKILVDFLIILVTLFQDRAHFLSYRLYFQKIKISVHFLSIVLNFYFSPEPLIFSRSNPHFHRSRFLRRAFQSLLTRAFSHFFLITLFKINPHSFTQNYFSKTPPQPQPLPFTPTPSLYYYKL